MELLTIKNIIISGTTLGIIGFALSELNKKIDEIIKKKKEWN